ncbi:MAG: ABC transporter substrate-binding protein, partial [Candidatus Acidiferrales bacterium]
MSCTAYRFPANNKVLGALAWALLASGLFAPARALASRAPKRGGVLQVEIRERIASFDPRQWPQDSTPAAANERVDSLLFDRLVRFDDRGAIEPALAVSWKHDASSKRWQFHLRSGVKFSDGAPLTPEIAAIALQQLLGNTFDVSATSDSVVIQADQSLPNFPSQLATGRYFIFHAANDGSLAGTGPFSVGEWPAGDSPAKIILLANKSCWAGRPFVDKIELAMGVDPQQQGNAIAFGQADVVELPASQVRREAQRGVRTASSDSVELMALQLDPARPAVQDVRIRQAISLAIDRASIADVILQRQGIATGSLLPNWISGYAHLFPIASDPARAKALLMAAGREVSPHVPLVLIYDSTDEEARAVAERVAVNLNAVGIAVQASGQPEAGRPAPTADLRLVRRRMATPDLRTTLAALLNSFGEPAADLETPEETYAAERAPIDNFRVIPL